MLAEFEGAVVYWLQEQFKRKMGVEMVFKYSPDMSLIEEYRRSTFLKINDTKVSDVLEKYLPEDTTNVSFCIWNRTPVVKSEDLGNNMPYTKYVIDVPGGHTLRDVFYGTTTFNFQFFSTENKITYLVELLYNTTFSKINPAIEIKYIIDGKETIIDYSTNFDNISDVSFIDVPSYGGLISISIEFTLKGWFFSPFYEFNDNTIREVDLKAYVLDGNTDLENMSNYNEQTLSCEEDCLVDENTHRIDLNTCHSLNETLDPQTAKEFLMKTI